MGTRGFVGFHAEGKTVITYNHFDSYPEHLGLLCLEWARQATPKDKERIAAMRVVSEETDVPTREDVKRLAAYTDLGVGQSASGDTTPNWYQLLRETQGNPGAILEAGVYEDASGFPGDSLFCEWGYLMDLHNNRFEVYRGFQKKPHEDGRFWEMPTQESFTGSYYPVRLLNWWPMDELPDDDTFMNAIREADQDDGE